MSKFEDIMSGHPICPKCNRGYLHHGFRVNSMECDNCGEIFDFQEQESNYYLVP